MDKVIFFIALSLPVIFFSKQSLLSHTVTVLPGFSAGSAS
jgi:hypothetical protein